jgi:hypothetical protein
MKAIYILLYQRCVIKILVSRHCSAATLAPNFKRKQVKHPLTSIQLMSKLQNRMNGPRIMTPHVDRLHTED